MYRTPAHRDRGSGYTTVLGGDRFGHHGIFVPGSGNTIGFEDLVTIEDYEFCTAVAEGRPFEPSFEQALAWAAVQDALLRSAQSGALGGGASADRGGRGVAPRRGSGSSASGGSAGCTPSCSPTRSPGRRSARLRRPRAVRPAASRPRSGVPAADERRGDLRRRSRRGRDLLELRHPRRPADRRGAGGQGGVLREAGVARSRRGRPRARRDRRRGRAVPDRLQPPVRPGARLGPRGRRCRARSASRTWCGSRAATPSRRRSTTSSAPGGLFLDMMIHDFDMARFVTGTEVVEVFARGALRIEPVVRRGRRHRHGDGDARARGRLPDRDRQLAAAPRTATTSASRCSARPGMAVSENPLAHTGVRDDRGRRAAARRIPYFFLERYLPSYVREWQAFVEARQDAGRTPPVSSRRRARPAGHRACGGAVAARGSSRARRGGAGQR